MRHQKKLDKVTAPAARFQGWKAMPLGSKIAVVVLVALALMAILAPELAPFKPGQSGLASVEEVVTLDDGTETNITSRLEATSSSEPTAQVVTCSPASSTVREYHW